MAKYAQGDIPIERVRNCMEAVPKTPIAADPDGLVVLGRGEFSGHRHAVHGTTSMYRVQRQSFPGMAAELYVGHLVVEGQAAVLKHEEHAPITLPPGTYRVRRQRVFTAKTLRAQLVRD